MADGSPGVQLDIRRASGENTITVIEGVKDKLKSIWTIVGAGLLTIPPFILVLIPPDLGTSLVFLAILVGVVAVAAVAGLALLGTTLQAVFTASVYRFATTGDGGTMFPKDTFQAPGTFGPGVS